MDEISLTMMIGVIKKYNLENSNVIDVGSYDENGTYRPLFHPAKYRGVDIRPGPNVDFLIGSDAWNGLKDIDVVVSGQTLEHVEKAKVKEYFESIYKILKPDGLFVISVPSSGPAHSEAFGYGWHGNYNEKKLAELLPKYGFEVLESETSKVKPWCLVCCVAKKIEVKKEIKKVKK